MCSSSPSLLCYTLQLPSVYFFAKKKNSKYKLYWWVCILLCRRWSDGRCSGASPSPCPSPVCVRTMCFLNFFYKKVRLQYIWVFIPYSCKAFGAGTFFIEKKQNLIYLLSSAMNAFTVALLKKSIIHLKTKRYYHHLK